MRPLLPAVDHAGRLREVGFALLLRDQVPIGVAELGAAAGLDLPRAQVAVASLADAGWLDVDASGRVTGAAGLSLATGPHILTIGAAPFRTWCAYDSLGIAAALGADAAITTACGHCDTPITLTMRGGIPDRAGPERLWLAERGTDLRGSFCTPTVLLCGLAHGIAWADAHTGAGRLLDLVEGASAGALDWARCAEVARRLA